MNITGIITEYNPLHNGHKYHISKSKEITKADGVICVMSGSFMQRGIPAIIDKWSRTKMALANGVDLVIELPVLYSLSSAEFFSYGAVSLLDSLGVVNNISFGSECGDIEILLTIAKILNFEPLEYKNLLKSYIEKNYSFAKSRSLALMEYMSGSFNSNEALETLLNSSNNILGIEYCKSLLKLNSKIIPHTITRLGASYNSNVLENEFSSATAIRSYLKDNMSMEILKKQLPIDVCQLINDLKAKQYPFIFEDAILPFLKYKVASCDDRLSMIPDASEGLHNRIKSSIESCTNYNDLIHSAKSKRYAYTRISRILCQYFVGFENFNTSSLRKEPCPYARILGFNNIGAQILKSAKKTSTIPLYTKIPKIQNDVLELDLMSTKVYSLLNKHIAQNSDYLIKPIIGTKLE
ncbi:MAG: nucleotidyltransferase [Clostridiaceae bacterium]|nr:nucleotidyltransferase [Clostridiaceae bacterium]